MTEDIHEMHFGDLKNKLLKLAQAYNTEKMRNKEFENTLRSAHLRMNEVPKMSGRLAELEEQHRTNAEKLLAM
jgi:hypothetical protein